MTDRDHTDRAETAPRDDEHGPEECDECGGAYEEPEGLKADSGACPACSGGDLSR